MRLQKYTGADADRKPKLNKLGTQEWNRIKDQGAGSGKEYCKRAGGSCMQPGRKKTGMSCGPDTVWQREFEEMFPYEETDDQLDGH